MTLNPKPMFEEIQILCYLIMKLVHLCYTIFAFCNKTFDTYMPKERDIFNQLIQHPYKIQFLYTLSYIHILIV